MTPFRFGVSKAWAGSRAEWIDFVTRASDNGFDTVLVPDHLGALSPAVAIAIGSEQATTMRFGSFVLNNDFRHPTIVAQESVTLDLLTEGRYDLGLGTGWNMPEYAESGIRSFDSGRVRVERLAESVAILRRLFGGEHVTLDGDHYDITEYVQEPLPMDQLPILIGGNGDRLLSVAAEHADIMNFTGFGFGRDGIAFTHFDRAGLGNRVETLHASAPGRVGEIELSILVQRAAVTNDPRGVAEAVAADPMSGDLDAERILASPFMLVGSAQSIADELVGLREEFGISYFAVFDGDRSKGFEEVVGLLAGT